MTLLTYLSDAVRACTREIVKDQQVKDERIPEMTIWAS